MSKDTIQKFVSPKGTLNWVVITGEGVENMSGKMQYKADINLGKLSEEPMKSIKAKIDAYWDEKKPNGFKKKPKSLGYYPCTPLLDENGNHRESDEGTKMYDPDGDYAISFKTATRFKDGNVNKVKVRNAAGRVVELGETKIGNGSIGYIAGAMDIYANEAPKTGTVIDAGVTFYLNEIKLTKLVEYGGEDPFGDTGTDDEDGWTGEDIDAFAGDTVGGESAKPRL